MFIIKKNSLKRMILWFMLVFVMGIIFYFSHQTGVNSQDTSDGLIDKLIIFLPKFIGDFLIKLDESEVLSYIVRKSAHFTIYLCLGCVSVSLCYEYFPQKNLKCISIAEAICVVYACSDEFHQSFIPGRSAELADVFIDSSGALSGTFLIIFIIFVLKKLKK